MFFFFTILGRTDILTENIFNDANNPITYNTHMFSTNTDKTMPFIDLSSNILALSFWGLIKRSKYSKNQQLKEYQNLYF